MPKRKSKRRVGAPTVLTTENQKKLFQAILAGNNIITACLYAGIGKTTYYEWMEKGENGDPVYIGFAEAMRDALAQCEMKLVMAIDKHAVGRAAQFDKENVRLIQDGIPPDWKAAAWMLERKFPDRWGKRDQVKVFGAEKGEDFRPDGSYEKFLETIQRLDSKTKPKE